MKSQKIIAVVGGSFLLAAAFLLILCIKICEYERILPQPENTLRRRKVEQTTTDKKEQKKPDWVEGKNFRMTLEGKSGSVNFIITPEALTGMGKVTAAGDTTKKMPGTVSGWWHDLLLQGISRTDNNYQICFTLRSRTVQSRVESRLFLSVDEEGGTVARVAGSGISNVSVVEDMCEVTDEERAYEIGQTIGNYLAELGFNLDYAPVGDVLTNPENYSC